jgi:hypothetical protein
MLDTSENRLVEMWTPIGGEPFETGLELTSIVDGQREWSIAPCRRVIGGWINCLTHEVIAKRPTHWRPTRVACPYTPYPDINVN